MEDTDVGAALDELRAELASLADLFRRRLMEDKARNGLYEALQEQARGLQEQIRRESIESFCVESLIAIDRLRSAAATPALVESAVEELLEVFARRAVIPVTHDGGFDPRLHEVVSVVPSTADLPPGTVVEVHRTGYTINGRLLRPSQVTVAAE